jgi:putative ABC transport system permease protein
MLLDYLDLAYHNIRSRQLRSWLTVLGIVIGVTAVVALIAIGQGMKRSVEREFEAIGYDTIIAFPGGGIGQGPGGGGFFGGGLTAQPINLDVIRQIPQVAQVGALRIETAMVTSRKMEGQGFLRVTGLGPGVRENFSGYFRSFALAAGRDFQPDDQFVAVLGNRLATDLGVTVGDEITIDNQNFTVIGILQPIEQGRGGIGFGNINNALFVPMKALETLNQDEGKVSIVLIKAAKGAKVSDVANRIKAAMSRQGTPVSTVTAEEISQRISGVLGGIQMTLAAIAAISLLVGAVGVMNTMYTSVLERTREIGILKAIGAKDGHILSLFLIESGLIGFLGGVIGVLCGIGLSVLSSGFVARALAFGPVGGGASFGAEFSVGLIIGTLVFSFVLGALSGVLPARQAAHLRPVEALRYE